MQPRKQDLKEKKGRDEESKKAPNHAKMLATTKAGIKAEKIRNMKNIEGEKASKGIAILRPSTKLGK